MALVFLDGGSARRPLLHGIDYARAVSTTSFRKPIENVPRELKTFRFGMQRLLAHARLSEWGHEQHFGDDPQYPTVFIQGIMAPSWVNDYQRSILEANGIDCANIGPRFDKGPWKDDVDLYVADFLRLWEEAGKVKLVIICQSFGCTLGTYIADIHPDKVQLLILQEGALEASSENIETATNLALLAKMMKMLNSKMHPEIIRGTKPISTRTDKGVNMVAFAAFEDGIIDWRCEMLKEANGRVTYVGKFTHFEGTFRRSIAEFLVPLVKDGVYASPTNSFNRLLIPNTGLALPLPTAS